MGQGGADLIWKIPDNFFSVLSYMVCRSSLFLWSQQIFTTLEEAQASKEDDKYGRVSSHPVTTSVISVCFRPDNCRCVRSSSRLEYSTGMALVKVNDDFHVGKFLALTPHPPRSPLLPMRGSENWETEHRISQEPHFTHLLHGTSAPWGDFIFSFCL